MNNQSLKYRGLNKDELLIYFNLLRNYIIKDPEKVMDYANQLLLVYIDDYEIRKEYENTVKMAKKVAIEKNLNKCDESLKIN